jgi:hypothetical protein
LLCTISCWHDIGHSVGKQLNKAIDLAEPAAAKIVVVVIEVGIVFSLFTALKFPFTLLP